MRHSLAGLLALLLTAACSGNSSVHTGSNASSSSGAAASSSSGASGGGSASSSSSGSGSSSGTGSSSSGGSGGSSGSLLPICGDCTGDAQCDSGHCDFTTHRCSNATDCRSDPSICARSGLTCDSNSGLCVCGGGTTSSSSSSSGSSSSSSSSSSGSSGATCSCDGCTNLGLGCDTANACSCTAPTGSSSSSGGSSSSSSGGGLCTSQRCVVYAETDHDLYQVDPANPNNITHLCTFNGDLGSTSADSVNDIAVRSDGALFAITKTDLYTVDPQSCAATWVAQVAQGSQAFNCLAFNTAGTLVAATSTGQVSLIDSTTGHVTSNVGSFGNSLGCSGDLVIVNNGSTDQIFATAKDTTASGSNDLLVKLSGSNYHATQIGAGDIGYKSVFGLGFWGGTLYGFDRNGHVLQIDVGTGVGTVLSTTNPAVIFYGAGTTPLAPIINR